VTHGPRTTKSVALTFDDGFNVPACISIVNTLLAMHATATFFPNGQYVRESPGFWHWVATSGFPIGNHATTHHDPTTLSAEQLVLSLESDRRILDETLGFPSINVFRPPFGSYDSRVLEIAGAARYPLVVGWDVDSKDQSGARDVSEVIANATAGTDGSIVLMHCGSPLTPLALPAIIDRYRARGFSFVTIPQMFGLPSPTAGWAPPTSPDSWPVVELAAADPRPSWNASPAIDASGHLQCLPATRAGRPWALCIHWLSHDQRVVKSSNGARCRCWWRTCLAPGLTGPPGGTGSGSSASPTSSSATSTLSA
jgi:peptidoglycan/xylan/chitin deacetylase (PgdA/CDA1 family)